MEVSSLSNQRFYHWLEFKELDSTLKKEMEAMSQEQIADAFDARVEFGTAGMRGLLGAGSNRLNIYTIRRATVGFAKYLQEIAKENEPIKVAIGYDNRYMSKEFALEAAQVLASFDISTVVYSSLRSTPQLSFTVRELGCLGGIMITASHNPKEYNGYKVYDATGCQLVPSAIEKVIKYVDAIEDELAININLSKSQVNLIHWIDHEIDRLYKSRVLDIQLRPELIKDIQIVFSPQHGAGFPTVFDVLNAAGYQTLLVQEQCDPDPAFSNTKSPNPEEKVAYEKSIELAKQVQADIIISTDPDADRVGVVVYHHDKYELMSGNQTGSVLIEYLFSTLKEKGLMPPNPVMFNTIVTSDLGELVANDYGVETEKTLTGFKFIGEKIEAYQKNKLKSFVLGYEESYGYLIEPFVRDKDAVQASLIIAEAAQYYKNQGKTLFDVLLSLYQRHGTFLETQTSLSLSGIEGSKQIAKIMAKLRSNPLSDFANLAVIKWEDYQQPITIINNQRQPLLGYALADVIKFYLEDGSWIAVRPSGTEPKCKFYYCIKGENQEDVNKKFDLFNKEMTLLIS